MKVQHFYRLVPALCKEAATVKMTYRLVSEQQVTRYQRETYRITQQRLTTLWTRYDNDFQKGNQTDFNNEYTSILSGELCQWQNEFSLLFLCNTETVAISHEIIGNYLPWFTGF